MRHQCAPGSSPTRFDASTHCHDKASSSECGAIYTSAPHRLHQSPSLNEHGPCHAAGNPPNFPFGSHALPALNQQQPRLLFSPPPSV
ncbi:hypothetical protein CLOM_g12403 [Closterium sp. NIES-68]|nr:hypothetical protein CLOM_g12403 [Closterium sp. NIES-68]